MSKGVNTRHLAGGQNDCLGLGLFSISMENRISQYAVIYYLGYWASNYFSDHSQILREFKHDEGIILARVQRDFKNTTPVSQNTAF